jgi:uncharacterized protein (TIGR00255 family)
MPNSMTAFARNEEQGAWGSATWEIRSVNHRFLEISYKMPEVLRNLEPGLREIAQKNLARGKVDCFLQYKPKNSTGALTLNTELIQQLQTTLLKLDQHIKQPIAPINPLQLLSWNNVLQAEEHDHSTAHKKILNLFNKTLHSLVNMRKQEGAMLKNIITTRLSTIKLEAAKVKKLLPKSLLQQRNKLLQKLEVVKQELDTNRLEQEMVYFTQKIDVTEELDRLLIHVQEMQNTIKQSTAIGKKLDFLTQELNREANTLAAKSPDSAISHIAVAIKVLIEQVREQIQNIE